MARTKTLGVVALARVLHSSMAKFAVFPLRCSVQQYQWGKIGLDSEVARLSQNDPEFQLDSNSRYAELWMGTHPKSPSRIADGSNVLLSDWLKSNQWALGSAAAGNDKGQLPFLFKVLSVDKALSIQAHPDKKHAEILHASDPQHYLDPNHKPEMALALTPFEGLCGFRPIEKIKVFMENISELRGVVGTKAADALVETGNVDSLRNCFVNLVRAPDEDVRAQLASLVEKVEKMKDDAESERVHLRSLLLRIHSQFPGDVGCFCIYFLNRLLLEPGQAMFLGPNIPHAYLSGDCIECMACSDNVVRAGLTPKFKDKETLCAMLDFAPTSPAERIFKSIRRDNVEIFDPPVEDFSVAMLHLKEKDESLHDLQPTGGPSIFIVIRGDGSVCDGKSEDFDVKKGSIVFVAANTPLKLCKKSGEFLLFRAYTV